MAKITWILPTIKWGAAGAGAATVIGAEIKANSVELVPIDGETKSVQNVRGQMIDEIQLAKNWELNFTLVAPTLKDMADVLSITAKDGYTAGTASVQESLEISGTMLTGYKEVEVIPDEGIGIKMPYCRAFTGIGYNGSDGFYMPMKILPLKENSTSTKIEFYEV